MWVGTVTNHKTCKAEKKILNEQKDVYFILQKHSKEIYIIIYENKFLVISGFHIHCNVSLGPNSV